MLRIGTALDELARLYPWLDTEAEARNVPKAATRKMHVALEEAVMNVAMHAYPPGESGEITISLLTTAEAASLVIEDAGPAFDPTAATPRALATSMADLQPGGLGLTLLRHYCDEIGYERKQDRNRLTLRFPIGRSPRPNPPEEPSPACRRGQGEGTSAAQVPKETKARAIAPRSSATRRAFRPGISGAAAPPRRR
jgi:serine/threonine-protein kinase RsbW